MKNIIIWNDYVLDSHYPVEIDEQLRLFFDRKFDQCQCQYLGQAETIAWKNSLSRVNGITIGTRPTIMLPSLSSIQIHRLFDKNRNVCGFEITEQSKHLLDELSEKSDEICFIEDCIVKGDTVRTILRNFGNEAKRRICFFTLASVLSNVAKLRQEYPFLDVKANYWLEGETTGEWDCTILFMSDLLSGDNMFINDRRRLGQCFYRSYDEVRTYCLENKNIIMNNT